MSKQVRDRTVKILYLVATCIVVFRLLGLNRFASLSFYAGVLCTILLWFECRNITKTDYLMMAMLWIALINILLSTLKNNAKLSIDYLEKYIHFASTCIFFSAASKFSISEKTADLIRKLNAITALCFVAVYFLDPIGVYLWNNRVSGYLMFRFENPNMTAQFLLCILMREFLSVFEENGFLRKLIHGILCGWMVFFLVLTGCRTAIIAVGAFLVLYLFLTVRKMKAVHLPRFVTAGIVVLPILFVAIYFGILKSDGLVGMFEFMDKEGKNLDSRQVIWTYALEYISGSPVIGAYGSLGTLIHHTQMHNTHLDVWVAYGPVVLTLFCVFLYRIIRVTNGNCKSRKHFIELIGFFAILLMGTGEAAMVSGGLGVYIFIGGFLLMANAQPE